MNRLARHSIVAIVVLSAAPAARAAFSSASEPRVAFQASGTAGLQLQGTTNELTVGEQDGNLVVTVALANLTTGISLRDKHMRDDLEVQKFPSAVLTIARSALKTPAPGKAITADVPGTLTLHGQTRPVTVHYDATADGSSATADGSFVISTTDFGITVPSYLGVTVKPPVTVTAHFRAQGS